MVKLIISQNSYGNYEDKNTHLVFDITAKKAIGKQVNDMILPLTDEDIDVCEKNGINYMKKEEQKYRKILIDMFVNRWQNNTKNFNNDYYKIKLDGPIKNVHDIEFKYMLIEYYKSSDCYTIQVITNKCIDDVLPTKNNIFKLLSSGKDIRNVFETLLSKINRYIFCKHCGDIVHIKRFYTNEGENNKDEDEINMCQKCVTNELLSLAKTTQEFCNICQNNTRNFITLGCGHHFHRACLSDLQDKKCPSCRKCIE